MFTKVYRSILASPLADDWKTRHVFEDFLKLADRDGVVDMTPQAIGRATGLPLEMIQDAIHALELPDPQSRTKAEEGRRIVLVDPARSWGWRIVNYRRYR